MPLGSNLTPSPEGEGEVVLGVDEGGRYFINGAPIAAEALEDQLTSIFAARETDKVLFFRADQNLKFSKIQEAVEVARRSGVRVMAAVTDKKSEGGLFDVKE
jgi:biopolymer transport protein ExbD